MRRSFATVAVAGLMVLALGVPAALAQAAPTRLLIVEMDGSGVGKATRDGVRERVEAGLAKHRRFEVQSTPGGSLIDEMFELECIDLDDDCLGKLAGKYSAKMVLVLSIDRDPNGGAVFEVKLFDTAAGGASSSFRRMGVAEGTLGTMAGDALVSLIGEPPAPAKPKKGTVKVTSGVPGATVRIGRVAAGETPFEGEVPPGTYPVIIKKDGYEEFVTRVTVKAGAVTTVAGKMKMIAAEPTPEPEKEPEPVPIEDEDEEGGTPIYKQWWFWTGIGAVLAGGIATTVLLLDQDSGPATGDLSLSLRPWDVNADPLFNP